MRRIQLVLFFLITGCITGMSQQQLKGKVIAADTQKPIAAANVFLSNTSIGAVSGDNGEFAIHNFPNGRYDLVVSCVGYETSVTIVYSNRLPASLVVQLKPKVTELQEVVVESYDKDGWDKWGNIFMENFMGTSSFSNDCKLVNKEAVKFRFSKKNNILRVSADEPLLIENKALGYILQYDLTGFEFDFTDKTFVYHGNALFKEMETIRKSLKEEWAANRREAYNGSLMHFMRSLFTNRLQEEQFEVRKMITVSVEEKKRVVKLSKSLPAPKQRYKTVISTGKRETVVEDTELTTIDPDSLTYYKSVREESAPAVVVFNRLLTADSLATRVDNSTVSFTSNEHLHIIYLPKKNLWEYLKRTAHTTGSTVVNSEIYIVAGRAVSVQANGTYFEGANLVVSNYWAWWEKMCNKLPYDYQPGTDNSAPKSKRL